MRRLSVLVSVLVLGFAGAAQSADLQGARAALDALAQRRTAEDRAKNPGGAAALKRDLEAFSAAAGGFTPADAAKRWLVLYDRYFQLEPEQLFEDGQASLDFGDVFGALPPPATWPSLSAAIQARVAHPKTVSDHGLLLFAALLTDDEAGAARELAGLFPLVRDGVGGDLSQIAQLQESLALRSGDPTRIYNAELVKLTSFNGGSLTVPDLVTLVGAQRAEALLRKALMMPGGLVYVQGEETLKLARRLALEMVAQLKAPPWSLAQSTEAAPLYEALNKRFPPNAPAPKPNPRVGFRNMGGYDPSDETRNSARLYYFLALVVSGRQAEALKVATEVRRSRSSYAWAHESLAALDQAGKPDAVVEFLRSALAKNPALPLWDLFITASARAKGSDAALKLMRSSLARRDLPPDAFHMLQRRLYHALLAADQLDEAIVELRKILNERPAKAEEDDAGSPAEQMVRIGYALGRNDLIEDGLAVLRRDRKDNPQEQGTEIPDILVNIGRDAEAEKELIDHLRATALAVQPGQPLTDGSDDVVRLAGIYYRAKRWSDVLALLKSAPNWSNGDLAGCLFEMDATETPLGQMAAAALAGSGDREAAISILHPLLQQHGGYDPAYALLVELQGERALPFLAELFARDQFEERPLIWKAQILLKAGKLEEAEASARAAIAIDPSDGEQKHGHRMKVYSVLADIREARGDAKQAELFRGAVKAIRSAETADVLYQAGLLDRGIKRYEQSLTYFADAYCIQSRLAVQLASQGMWDQAEEHYRRAFELMPDSFGRMESHCFGCEGVFGGKRAEGIAERVFKSLQQKTPDKPQVYYLMAYLRQIQGRYAEALQSLREAVKRDPDYLNAWKLMLTVGAQIRLPAADRDAAVLALMRLDPLGRHVQMDVSEVSTLKGVWEGTARIQSLRPPPLPKKLYDLEATRAVQEKLTQGEVGRSMGRFGRRFPRYGRYSQDPDEPEIPTPGMAVAQHRHVLTIRYLIESDVQRRRQGN